MFSALDIAKWFLYKNNAEVREHETTNDNYEVYEGITHLKLQKLLYYAQGINLAINGEKLFDEAIEAWEHGPVIREVYDTYKVYGRNSISIEVTDEDIRKITEIEEDKKTIEVLNITYDNFAIYTAWQLRQMTHVDGSPWDITEKQYGQDAVIDVDLIKKYFQEEILE